MDGWKLKNLKKKSFDEIQKLFDSFMKRVNTFVDMNTDIVEERAPRENRDREHVRRNVTVETTDAKALVAQDKIGYDWSDQTEDGPTNFALMAYTSSANKNNNFNKKVNVVKGNIATAKPRAVVSDDKVNPQLELQEKGVIDSGCSRHMTRNMSCLFSIKKLMVDMLPLEETPKEVKSLLKPTKSLHRTTNTRPRHEFVYKTPSIQNENDKGDVAFIEEDEIKPILTVPNPKPINSNSPTVSPYLKDCTMHIPYTNTKTFADNVLLNHVGDEELNSIDGVGNREITKKNKDDNGVPKQHNKE
nr:hypothetical protein [Tanacetum cinerariifolium]